MRNRTLVAAPVGLALLSFLSIAACGSSRSSGFDDGQKPGDGTDGGLLGTDGGFGGEAGPPPSDGRDPATCEEAAQSKSYVGCDYWPTVTSNIVNPVFDFAVAVANVGADKANVTVTGPNNTNQKVTVDPGSLTTVFLPWNTDLKGNETTALTASVLSKKGAFHLVSDKPVVVYQFNPLEFQATGGPPGKDWSACVPQLLAPACYSYSNDASLLLPSTAMTGNYRVMGSGGMTRGGSAAFGSTVTVTATADGTKVDFKVGGSAQPIAGGGINAGSAGQTVSFTLDAGDVAELTNPKGTQYDFSGSLVTADKPVQVITGVPCLDEPINVQACDHVEETVFPAETLGKHYVVLTPTGPKANKVGQVVRFYGNIDNTTLTYAPSPPKGCPTTLNAGQVVDCGKVDVDFEVSGDQSFGVGTFQIGGEQADPDFDPNGFTQPQGDPSQSFPVAVEQYRQRYVFLAPTDYKTSYVDVVASGGTALKLDGADVSGQLGAIAGTQYQSARLKLGQGKGGVHTLEADKPVGIQVIGYGDNTTYQYPGGLNLGRITTAPPK